MTVLKLAIETAEPTVVTEEKPGALVVVAVVVLVVGGVVVVVEEKIEPDAASVEVGVNKAVATKVACGVIGPGPKEVKDPAELVLVNPKEGALKEEVEVSKKEPEEVGVKAETKQPPTHPRFAL